MSDNNKNMTTSPSASSMASPDAGMDLAAIMANQQQQSEETKKVEEKKAKAKEAKEKKKTPLEELRERQMSGAGKGMVVDNDKFEEKEPVKRFRNPVESDERLEAFNDSIKESDERLKKRQAVVLIKRPTEQADYINVETELDAVQIGDDGVAYFDYKTTNAVGEEIVLTPEWFIIRTPEYGPYNEDTEKLYSLGRTPDEVKEILEIKKEEGGTVEEALKSVESGEKQIGSSKDDSPVARKQLVQILIDKTASGSDRIELTDEERKKVVEADQILVTSVKKLDLAGVKIKPSNADQQPPRSFLQVAREHQLADSHADVAFAVSGYRGQMRGLTYGELSDISIDPEGATFDEANKQASVIYNAMISTNRPEPFKDYEDFLKNFSWFDMEMAIYGMYVATFPDTQYIDLKCGRKSCEKNFQQAYNTRSILRIEDSDDIWVDLYGKVVMAKPYEVPTVFSEAPLQTPQYFELPYSKYIIEISPASMYDYLYNILPIGDDEEFRKLFGPKDEVSPELQQALDAIGVVRRILVPENGEYVEFTSIKDLTDAIMSLVPDEAKIVRSIVYKTLSTWSPVFGVPDVECPHCHATTHIIPMSPRQMVFRAHEQQVSTTIDVTSLLQI